MRIVLDTNVLVSGLLDPNGAPGRVLDLILDGRLQVLRDDRIVGEYRDVLARPYLHISDDLSKSVIDYFQLAGERITASPLPEGSLPDPDDLPFLELAIAGKADALVTGNVRYFPENRRRAARVESPATFLARFK